MKKVVDTKPTEYLEVRYLKDYQFPTGYFVYKRNRVRNGSSFALLRNISSDKTVNIYGFVKFYESGTVNQDSENYPPTFVGATYKSALRRAMDSRDVYYFETLEEFLENAKYL